MVKISMIFTSHIKNLFLISLGLMIVIFFIIWNSTANNIPRFSTIEKEPPIDVSKVCSVSLEDKRTYIKNDVAQNVIYFVTPTYPRPEQTPELIRLGHTLMHVPRIHWIVADDAAVCNSVVDGVLRRTGLPFTHIMSPMPERYHKAALPPRGVANRRAALDWIGKNAKEGVVYFGDDDNTFDLRLFDEIRRTKKVSMFPVGLIGDYGISSPVVHNGQVVGFFDSWPARRAWPVDMAGFALNVASLRPNASMPYTAGYEEDQFLRGQRLRLDDVEPRARNCTEVYVWHTQTKRRPRARIRVGSEAAVAEARPQLAALLARATSLGMSEVDARRGAVAYVSREGKSERL